MAVVVVVRCCCCCRCRGGLCCCCRCCWVCCVVVVVVVVVVAVVVVVVVFVVAVVVGVVVVVVVVVVLLVAKTWPLASLTWTMSKEPGCLSRDMMVPTLPVLRPPVIMHRLPESNLMVSWILPVAMSTWMLSYTLMMGSG